jgi:hypothetical protein
MINTGSSIINQELRNQQLKEATAFPDCEGIKVQKRSYEKVNQERNSEGTINQKMQGRSGIELEAIIGHTMEQQNIPNSKIEEEMRHQARSHLKLDMSAMEIWRAAQKPNNGLYEVINYDDIFRRRMQKFKRDISRGAHRLNLFSIPHFKVWIDPRKKIELVAIGGETPGKEFISYDMYIDERTVFEADQICMGEMKVYPVGEINGRAVCILGEEVKHGKEYLPVQTVAKVYIPRSEVSYLFFLHLTQKEDLKNVITRYRREDHAGEPGPFTRIEEKEPWEKVFPKLLITYFILKNCL